MASQPKPNTAPNLPRPPGKKPFSLPAPTKQGGIK